MSVTSRDSVNVIIIILMIFNTFISDFYPITEIVWINHVLYFKWIHNTFPIITTVQSIETYQQNEYLLYQRKRAYEHTDSIISSACSIWFLGFKYIIGIYLVEAKKIAKYN